MVINIGDIADLLSVCTNRRTGALVDPGAMSVRVTFPDTTQVTYTTVSSPPVVRESLGLYSLALPATQSGRHIARFIGTGANAGVEEIPYDVMP
ncbi:MAG: hypothetical protein M3O91_10215 [Chloroflexota bacterium]|nr:hypothetical protein [Chloroflexota bacterium]